MAKRKQSSRRRQPQHKKQKKSQHDKRQRLLRINPKRKRTGSAKIPLVGEMLAAVAVLQSAMDRRIAFRLAIIVAGMMLADDRRTVRIQERRAKLNQYPMYGKIRVMPRCLQQQIPVTDGLRRACLRLPD